MGTCKIGILCDMHLPGDKESPQYAFLQRAVERMKKDGIKTVICLGDISRFGEVESWQLYFEALQDFTHYEVVGNSDVRNSETQDAILKLAKPAEFTVGSRSVIGLNTPYGEITAADRAALSQVKDGDIIFLHHYIDSLQKESREWLTELARRVPITILHGHGHYWVDYFLEQTRVWGMRGLDPDKSIGDFPCINYLEVSDEEIRIEEHLITIPKEYFKEASAFFGISCVDNAKDIAYAAEHHVKYLELRCDRELPSWPSLAPLLETWREKCDGYLSVHMPNLYDRDGRIEGHEQWVEALQFAVSVGADSLTMHPPRAGLSDMKPGGAVWKEFLSWYLLAAEKVPKTTKLGIENLHRLTKEKMDENRGFGYTPQEVGAWIDALNQKLGAGRVGHVLDVGHARNNDPIAQKYPIGYWYAHMGQKAVAYHIHQVTRVPDGLQNHCAIENWFGPMINFTSFFYEWHRGRLGHVPVFLEVKGWENYEKSVDAFWKVVAGEATPAR